jgi:hypothetical protein
VGLVFVKTVFTHIAAKLVFLIVFFLNSGLSPLEDRLLSSLGKDGNIDPPINRKTTERFRLLHRAHKFRRGIPTPLQSPSNRCLAAAPQLLLEPQNHWLIRWHRNRRASNLLPIPSTSSRHHLECQPGHRAQRQRRARQHGMDRRATHLSTAVWPVECPFWAPELRAGIMCAGHYCWYRRCNS